MKRAWVPFACVLVLGAKRSDAACVGRPTDPGGFQGYSYDGSKVDSYATAQARVHWAASGPHAPVLASTRGDNVPDTVAFAAMTAEDALTRYAAMGFRKVPSDAGCPANGGDDKLDIYLVQFAGADGSTAPECIGENCSSFVLVESTFRQKGYANAEEGFRTVVAHELFHAIQNAYRPRPEPFWAEGTAQWGMKLLFPELQDFERQLPAFFSDSKRSLDAAPAGVTASFLYGSSVWPLFLSLRHGSDVVREILELESQGQDPLPATDAVLKTKGSSLAEAYPVFAAWNAATGKVESAGGYPNAANYPGTTVAELADGVGGITSGLGYFVYRGVLDASFSISLETDPARNGALVVPIEAGTAQLAKAQKLPATVAGEVLVVVAGTTTKKSDAPFTVRLGPPADANPKATGDEGCHAAKARASGRARPERRVDLAFACVCAAGFAALRSRRRAR